MFSSDFPNKNLHTIFTSSVRGTFSVCLITFEFVALKYLMKSESFWAPQSETSSAACRLHLS
jgi:hypothetical protein